MKKVLLGVCLYLVTVVSLSYFTNIGTTPDTPPLKLEVTNKHVWITPDTMASLILKFDSKTDTMMFANSVLAVTGVLGVHRLYNDDKVYRIVYDPGHTTNGKLLQQLYPIMDNPNLFL